MSKHNASPVRFPRGPLCILALVVVSTAACAAPNKQAERPLVQEFPPGWRYPPVDSPLRAVHGMVVSTDSLASAAGISTRVTPVETMSLLYATRAREPGEVACFGIKNHLPTAALPAGRSPLM